MIDTDYFDASAQAQGFKLSDRQLKQFYEYAEFLLEYNKKVNLTAIKNPREVAVKHFLDSMLVLKYVNIPPVSSIIDVGTGAGFPGMVLKITRPDLNVTLLDGTNKRIIFLKELNAKLNTNASVFLSRAEEAYSLREKFDFACARAVAPLNILCEFCMPFVKTGGEFIAMKGGNAARELENAQNAIKILGGKTVLNKQYDLEDNKRTLICIKKISQTPTNYPRVGGKIQKKPL